VLQVVDDPFHFIRSLPHLPQVFLQFLAAKIEDVGDQVGSKGHNDQWFLKIVGDHVHVFLHVPVSGLQGGYLTAQLLPQLLQIVENFLCQILQKRRVFHYFRQAQTRLPEEQFREQGALFVRYYDADSMFTVENGPNLISS
jgi:hypothetical protein